MESESQIVLYLMDKVKEFCHGIYVGIDQLQTLKRTKLMEPKIEQKIEKPKQKKVHNNKMDSYSEISKPRQYHTPDNFAIHSEPSKSPDSDESKLGQVANENGFLEFFQNIIADVNKHNSKLEVPKVVKELSARFKALPEDQQRLWKPNIGGIVRKSRKKLAPEEAPKLTKRKTKPQDATPILAKKKCTRTSLNSNNNKIPTHTNIKLPEFDNNKTAKPNIQSVNIPASPEKSPQFTQATDQKNEQKPTEKPTTPLTKQEKVFPLIQVKNDRPSPTFSILNNTSRA
jgi:hypothetical protein